MPLKIFHTSDIHLGMKFASYPDIRAELREARFETLERLVGMANEAKCDLFVVAGDLFDQVSVAKKDVIRAAKILDDFQGRLVVVVPGNHDFFCGEHEKPWSDFKENSVGNILVTGERVVYPLYAYGLGVHLYPGVCTSKHSSGNAIGWIGELPEEKEPGLHIGVAHGSVEGLSPDFDNRYYPMARSELHQSGVDLWLIGHTHVAYPPRPGPADRIFCAGTPEPDGFDCVHEGAAWILQVEDDGKIQAHMVKTGHFRFLHEEAEVNSAGDLKDLEARYARAEYKRALLKLTLRGKLSLEEYPLLPGLREALGSRLFYALVKDDGVREQITLDTINEEFTEGSFPHRLLTSFTDDPEVLQAAYDLIREGRR